LIRAAGLGFRQIGGREFPSGSLRPLDQALGRLQGMKALNFIFQRFCQNSAMVLRDAPHALRAERIDALIGDQAECAGGSVAERIGLPFVAAILTLPLNLDPCVPFSAFHSQPEAVRGVPTRNLVWNTRIHFMASELCTVVNRQRKTWGLLPQAGLDAFTRNWLRSRRCHRALIFLIENCRPHFITRVLLWIDGSKRSQLPLVAIASIRGLERAAELVERSCEVS
jgi:hypothetical protein